MRPWLLAAAAMAVMGTALVTYERVPAQTTVPPATGGAPLLPLRVSDNQRHLVDAAGAPFFWLGDTAWLLFQMTSRDDAELYLRTRAQQGFTVIQAAVVMGEERVGGTLRANVYGDQAFVAGNPAVPQLTPGNNPQVAADYDYWDHADFIIERAAAHGLRIALLPLFVGNRDAGYSYLTPDRAYSYGLFLGQRYRDRRELIWVLGGDNSPDTDSKQAVWRDVARGITTGVAGVDDYSQTLMTYHINGNLSSSRWFHSEPWLDFNMVQIWGNEPIIYQRLAADLRLTPLKPTGLGEGSYEDGLTYETSPITAHKVRQQAYWSYFAGGYHTYGNTNTWNFGSYLPEVTDDWRRALDAEGAGHLSVLAGVLGALPWWTLEPDQAMFASGAGTGGLRNVAMRAAGDLAVVYFSNPGAVSLRLTSLAASGGSVEATWVDPRSGGRLAAGTLPAGAAVPVSSPAGWPDALLILQPSPAR